VIAEFQALDPILIVDDEPVNLKLLERILSQQGYRNLVLIDDPREAVARYQAIRPALILLDIMMPHMNGYEVMEQLKALNDPVMPPIVVLTALSDKDTLVRVLKAGARDFIGKPFDRNELLMRVRNLLDAHLAYRLVHDQKAALEKMVRCQTEELRRTQFQVVKRLGRIAEHRDEETGNHILRVSHTAALLAHALGWSEADCELLLHASPMHDIGKIGIPDSILLKPGKLDADERRTMETHVTIGAAMLEGDCSPLMHMAREIVLAHHEKWDGSGYPNRLAGAAIPLPGRIVALADVFDALTSDRPYKPAWPIEAAVDLVQSESDGHFDPEVVAAFLCKLPEILVIRSRFSESGMG
jgi:putative two-component system response regulator